MSLELVGFRKDREGNWKRVNIDGFAQKNDKGGIDVVMFTVPAPDNGMVRFVIQKRQEREDKSQQQREPQTAPASQGGDPFNGGDGIPF